MNAITRPLSTGTKSPAGCAGRALSVDFTEARIDALFARLNQCERPGGAVGIAIDGKPVYRKGFGLANMELPVMLSPKMRMRIYSTTKHFTCLAYLLLCEEGRATLDDPIRKHVPEIHPSARNATVRQLMGHISGLRDSKDICFQFSGAGRPVLSGDLVAMYRDIDDVNSPPGTTWSYNNGGYLLLTTAIERLSGRPLEEVLRERIFEPVGMYDTLLRRFDTDFVPNSATMHTSRAGGGYEKSYLGAATAGEGGIVSTVDDLLAWMAHMDAPRIGRPATWAQMKEPLKLLNGTSTGYGLGLMSGTYRGAGTLHHAGSGMGANSQMLKVPAAGLDVVVLLNRSDLSSEALVYQVLDACLPDLDPVRSPGTVRLPEGLFRSPTSGRVIQLGAPPSGASRTLEQGRAVVTLNGFDLPVEPDGAGVLWPAGTCTYMKIGFALLGDPQKPAGIRLTDFGNPDELVPVAPSRTSDFTSIVGRYRSVSTGTEAEIHVTEDGPRLSTRGRFGSVCFQLESLAEHLWRARSTSSMPWGGILTFDPGGRAFRYSSYLTQTLAFRRDN